jgi:raffinose/stachyose/melibiose transport system permease protein
LRQDNRLYSYNLLIPALIIYGIFFVLPSLLGLYYSLTDWTIGKDTIKFVGFENFKYIFTDDELKLALSNTFKYTILVVIMKNLFGLLLALAVNSRILCRDFYRTVIYMPAVMSTIVIGLIFIPILQPQGILNDFLNAIHLPFLAQDWLGDRRIVIFTIACVSVWQWTGYHMAIYLAGLQTISQTYYEAALIDGATIWQKLRYITLPFLRPSINVNVMLSLIGGIKVFSEVYALTNGGPGNASQVLTTEVLARFADGRWGLGTALNVVLTLIVGIISIPLLRKLREGEIEE